MPDRPSPRNWLHSPLRGCCGHVDVAGLRLCSDLLDNLVDECVQPQVRAQAGGVDLFQQRIQCVARPAQRVHHGANTLHCSSAGLSISIREGATKLPFVRATLAPRASWCTRRPRAYMAATSRSMVSRDSSSMTVLTASTRSTLVRTNGSPPRANSQAALAVLGVRCHGFFSESERRAIRQCETSNLAIIEIYVNHDVTKARRKRPAKSILTPPNRLSEQEPRASSDAAEVPRPDWRAVRAAAPARP